jgi:SAM-dependent methyltransferase
MSPNYRYVFERALTLSGKPSPRVLDYGCGRGEVVTYGRSQGREFFGVDRIAPASERPEFFRPLDGDQIQFDDGFFDVVIANQVFEHVKTPPAALREIARILKPGGVFLALFPDRSVWFEGHVGLYFVHRMSPRVARLYMETCHRLGFGYFREGKTAKEWAAFMAHQLETDVFYHSPADLRAWWTEAFGSAPLAAEHDFMRFRLGPASRFVCGGVFSPLLSLVCRKRAGIVWQIVQAKSFA